MSHRIREAFKPGSTGPLGLDWIRTQTDVREYFAEAESLLREKGILHKVATAQDHQA